MDDTLKGVLRWMGVAVAMLLVVFITVPLAIDAVTSSVRIGDETVSDEGLGRTDDPTEGEGGEGGQDLEPVDTDSAEAIADLSIRNGQVRQADESFVAIGGADGDGVILVFDQFSGSPECINIVNVLFTPLQATPETALIVAASTVTDAPELTDGDDLPDPTFVEDGPTAEIVIDSDSVGEMQRVNVTEIYQAWIAGEVGDPAAPFTVTIRPPDTVGERRIQVASIDGDDPPPRLGWSGVEACGSPSGS